MKRLFLLLATLVNSIFSVSLVETNRPVYIALKQQNIKTLEKTLAEISDPFSATYRQWLTTDEINRQVNPPIEVQSRVLDWISSYQTYNLNNYGDVISFHAEERTICHMFSINNQSAISNYQVPFHLREDVSFVEMNSYPIDRRIKINQAEVFKKKKRKEHKERKNNKNPPTFQADDRYFSRESLLRLYNVSNHSLAGAVSGGLIEYQHNAGFTNGDLNNQQTANDQVTNNVTNIVGDNFGMDDESELDVQLMSQAADGISLWYWNSPYWLYSLAVDFYNAEDIPDVISMSWGWAEDSQCSIIDCQNITSQQYVERVNNEYLKISLRGTTILASSGDAGAPGRTAEGCSPDRPINPIFPTSSPYVLSIGATFVPLDNSTVNYTSPICQNNSCITSKNEHSISYEHVGWTAGGGFSLAQKKTPYWQKKAVDHYLNTTSCLPNISSFNIKGRAYPDVSAIGHSCPTFINGELDKVDGTSCSSPVVAGLVAIINHHEWVHSRRRVGYLNPLLYYIQDNCPNCFNDVLVGHNWCTEQGCCDDRTQYGFQATFGYDPVTGLGTLNVANILEYLDTLFS